MLINAHSPKQPHQPHQRKKKRKRDYCDTCDTCTCGGNWLPCDFSLMATLLTFGAVAARATPAPLADRTGRAAILGYRRWLSHRWPGTCRFTPTCSAYGLAAVERYGLRVGGRLAADRVRRCRPEVPHGTPDPLR